MTWTKSAVVRWSALGFLAVLVVVVGTVGIVKRPSASASRSSALATNPDLDPGTKLSGPAPDFILTDQFGRPVSLSAFRGRVVILAFNDSQCTTICPLTTTAMVQAQRMLGPAASQVQLLGIDANPAATSVRDVRAYSEAHGMMRQWHFGTGALAQLKRVWSAYHVGVAIESDQIDHTPALFVIDRQGRLARLYMTQQSYSAVGQFAQILAREAASLLPGRPVVHSDLSYDPVSRVSPSARVSLPAASGGTVTLGPERSGRLFLFFASWDAQVTHLAGQVEALNRYQAAARARGLPPLTAVDEASVEPSKAALSRFLTALPRPLSYPVAVDQTGRVADGYGVQDEPWLVLISSSGQPVWYYNVSTQGWLSEASLVAHVRAAMTHAPRTARGKTAVNAALAGSPAPLGDLHQQAGQLLGSNAGLSARLRALRGYPVVLNAWASWCGPCKAEFGLLASAAAHYGRQVAFLGADSDDSSGDARSFLAQHPISYPSYQTSTSRLASLAQIIGLPTTIFLNRAGKVVHVQTGQYESQGALNADIASYGLGH
jgi:cytochrome oxidase Cu insertion factor (SCO1/SenC/PrrC family)/thiol-disulfide isomerase/thioredoxin